MCVCVYIYTLDFSIMSLRHKVEQAILKNSASIAE